MVVVVVVVVVCLSVFRQKKIIPAKNPNRGRFGFIDLIHWFDSSSRFIDSIPWFDSWFDSLIRFLVELDVVFLLGELDVVFLLGEIGSFSSKSAKNHYVFHQRRIRCCFCVKQLSSQKCVKRNRLDKNREKFSHKRKTTSNFQKLEKKQAHLRDPGGSRRRQ